MFSSGNAPPSPKSAAFDGRYDARARVPYAGIPAFESTVLAAPPREEKEEEEDDDDDDDEYCCFGFGRKLLMEIMLDSDSESESLPLEQFKFKLFY